MMTLPDDIIKNIGEFCDFFEILVLKKTCTKFNGLFLTATALLEWTQLARYDFSDIRLSNSAEKIETEVQNQAQYIKKKLVAYLNKTNPNYGYLNTVAAQLKKRAADSTCSEKKLIQGFYQKAGEEAQHNTLLEIANLSKDYPVLADFMLNFGLFCNINMHAKSWGGYQVSEKLLAANNIDGLNFFNKFSY